MKRLLHYITLSLLLIPLGLNAQKHGEKRDKIIEAKKSFINSKVDLSTDQAANFWPVYNEFEKQRHQFRRQLRQHMKKDISSYSEEEAVTYLNVLKSNRDQLIQLENDYFQKFRAILSAKQQANLIQAELKFRKELEKRIKDH